MSSIELLQNWFTEQCDGEWEHEHGIKIETLDNPGWKIVIPLTQTKLCNKNFTSIDIERGENDWVFCEKKDFNFYGYGGSKNLPEIIMHFISFSQSK